MEILKINYNMEILEIIKNCRGIVLNEIGGGYIGRQLNNPFIFVNLFTKIEKVWNFF